MINQRPPCMPSLPPSRLSTAPPKDWRGVAVRASSSSAERPRLQVRCCRAQRPPDRHGVRVPTADVDLTVTLKTGALMTTSARPSRQQLRVTQGHPYTDDAVSSDFITDPHSSIFDAKAGIALDIRQARIAVATTSGATESRNRPPSDGVSCLAHVIAHLAPRAGGRKTDNILPYRLRAFWLPLASETSCRGRVHQSS